MATTVAQMNLIITNYVSALSDKEQLRFIANSLKQTKVYSATPSGVARAISEFAAANTGKDAVDTIKIPVISLNEETAKKFVFVSKAGTVKVRDLQQIVLMAIKARTKKYIERGAETSYLLIQELKRIDREMGTEFYEHYKMSNPTPVVMVQAPTEPTPETPSETATETPVENEVNEEVNTAEVSQ